MFLFSLVDWKFLVFQTLCQELFDKLSNLKKCAKIQLSQQLSEALS